MTDDTVASYLEGTLTTVAKAACELHLISCDACREKLAAYMRILQPETSAEENAAIEEVTAQWQRRGLRPLPSAQPRSSKINPYVAGGIAAALLIGFLFILRGYIYPAEASLDNMIQDLYMNARPFDAQLSNEPYRAFSPTRSLETRPSMRVYVDEMDKQSADAYRRGLVFLYFSQFDNAIPFLEKAASDPNVSPAVLNDLGVAYLERDSQRDSFLAETKFQDALAKDDKFLPAIFNLALAYEHQSKLEDANQEWERYLKVDSSSGWADDVRKKQRRDTEK